MTHAPPNWVFSMFSFIGFILCCIPFPWHFAAWNTGTCLYMAWTGLMCLILFINSIVWNNNAINWAPVWCDITARMYIGLSFAIPATSLCIARRLYKIAVIRNVIITKSEKRQAIIADLAIGLGIPVLGMILQYIPQGHRFNIMEKIGCYPSTYNTTVAIALVFVPPILIGCVSGTYAVLGILAFNRSRKEYNQLLSNTHLTSHRYVRLMCLTGFGSLCTVTLGSYVLYRNVTVLGVRPWKGWMDTHVDFSRVDQYPAIVWRNTPGYEASIELSRWLTVLCAFTFFAFFGFAEEARRNYSSAVRTFARSVGLSSTVTGSLGSSFFNTTGTGIVSKAGHPNLSVYTSRRIRKGSDVNLISNISVSIEDVGDHCDEKEKPFSSVISCGAASLMDVGGAFADYKANPQSFTSTSGSSSVSSLSSPRKPPSTQPHPSLPRQNSIDKPPVSCDNSDERHFDTRSPHDMV